VSVIFRIDNDQRKEEVLNTHTDLKHKRVSRQAILILFFSVFLLGTFLRLYNLGFKGFWGDEIWTIQVSIQSCLTILRKSIELMLENFIPGPFYYLLAHISLAVFGQDHAEFALRFPSALAGSLAISAVYIFARRLWGDPEGIIASLLLAVSPYQVWYSQEARFYAWTTFLSIVSTFCIFRALEHPKKDVFWICFVISSVLNLYNQPLPAVIVLGSQGCYALVRTLASPKEKLQLAKAGASFILVALGYVPVIYKVIEAGYLGNYAKSASLSARGFFAPDFQNSFRSSIFICREMMNKFAAEGLSGWVFLVLFVIGIYSMIHTRRPAASLVLFLAPFGFSILTFAVGRPATGFIVRYILFLQPLYTRVVPF
jgi:4-amino-4-deoxy-L-arabinose transferase-like glycosyltransferase